MKTPLDTGASEDVGADFAKALDEGWLPIREVARQTGVNAVTLRAWERRYGLIVPQRTPKGHRLFSRRACSTHSDDSYLAQSRRCRQPGQATARHPQAFTESVENDWQCCARHCCTRSPN